MSKMISTLILLSACTSFSMVEVNYGAKCHKQTLKEFSVFKGLIKKKDSNKYDITWQVQKHLLDKHKEYEKDEVGEILQSCFDVAEKKEIVIDLKKCLKVMKAAECLGNENVTQRLSISFLKGCIPYDFYIKGGINYFPINCDWEIKCCNCYSLFQTFNEDCYRRPLCCKKCNTFGLIIEDHTFTYDQLELCYRLLESKNGEIKNNDYKFFNYLPIDIKLLIKKFRKKVVFCHKNDDNIELSYIKRPKKYYYDYDSD